MAESRSFPYIAGTLLLIVTAIAATSILNRTTSTSGEDIRAKATVPATLTAEGTVASSSENEGIFVVDNLHLTGIGDTGKNLGTWTITPSSAIDVTQLTPGLKVEIVLDPQQFIAAERTAVAVEVLILE